MSTNALTEHVLRTARERGYETLLLRSPAVVAVSGGADSIAMLDMLLDLRGEGAHATMQVVHINHGLRRDEADADARFVSEFAQSRGLRCTVEDVDARQEVKERGLSLEDAARRLRYAVLARLAADARSTVITAHTADDQAETVMMNLLRGAGLTGLGGMRMLSVVDPVLSRLSEQVGLFRPMLHVWRAEIEAYCAERGLEPRVDSTNADTSFRRNRVRHELLPLLEREYSPAVKEHLVRLAEVAGDEDALLDAMAIEYATKLADDTEGEIVFAAGQFAALSVALQRRVIRILLFQAAGTMADFSFEAVEHIRGMGIGRPDSTRAIDLPHGVRVRREGSYVIFGEQGAKHVFGAGESRWPTIRPEDVLRLEPGCVLALASSWAVECSCLGPTDSREEPGELAAVFDMDEVGQFGALVLRTRRPGDIIKPLGLSGSKSLHDLFIDAKIPRGVRDQVALLTAEAQDGEVLWVPGPGGRRSARAPVGEGTRSILQVKFSKTGAD